MTYDNLITDEVWKVAKDYPNYEISNYGRLRNRITGYYLKYGFDKDSYFRVSLRNGSRKSYPVRIHQLVARTFLPQPKGRGRLQVNHKDGIKTNNHVSNLEWVTLRENRIHAVKILGKYYHGKHSKETILKIHDMRMQGISPSIISKELNVGLSHVEQILQRKVRKKDLEGLPTNYPGLCRGPRAKHSFIPRNRIRQSLQ